ncbi:hypothetical protein AB0C38_10635 [Amycolatopsis sp. NPDC048633]|uniref:hypothetical protein n=1 Tax=Amycolatopsis sp. NPDC048633 TaxID=3157095 RepID=UPI0033D61B7B
MTCLYVLDVPENTPLVELSREQDDLKVRPVGPYWEITSDGPIVIDRRATGMRHAVWYSCVAGITRSRIAQWDKNALRLEES